MDARRHFTLLGQAMLVWLLFWLAGLPHYFQQYSVVTMGVLCTLLATAFGIYAAWFLARRRRGRRMRAACWFAFYYSLPFFVLDALYCGLYLGLGWDFLRSHWYLTVFYFSIWIQFPLTAWALDRVEAVPAAARA